MALRLFNAGDEAGGTFTSGGTESQLLAVKAARNRALTERPELARPSIVVPRSCHPSIDKAAHYLGLDVRRVPISAAFRADPAAIAEAIDDRPEEHPSELPSLMRTCSSGFCLKEK